MLDRNPRLQLGIALYTDDGSGNLKSINLLNGAGAFELNAGLEAARTTTCIWKMQKEAR